MYSFNKIYGHEKVVNNLQSAIKNNRVPHAVIFSGESGVGKSLLANTFAKALQCMGEGEKPCNSCISCKAYENGNHTEVYFVHPTKTKVLGINDIREQIINKMAIKPYQSKYKIFIVENADEMTVQAQNALLKTIEEPFDYGVFLLNASNYENFLPTILSRSVLFKLKPVTTDIVSSHIINEEGIEPEIANAYAIYSGGNIGRAKELINDEAFSVIRKRAIDMAISIEKEPEQYVFTALREIEGLKDRVHNILDIMYLWYRDLAVYKQTENSLLVSQKDELDRIKSVSTGFSLKKLIANCEAIAEAKRNLLKYGNFNLIITVMLMNLNKQLI